MLSITQLQPGVAFLWNNKPYIVEESKHSKLGRGGGIQQVKMRSLQDGTVITQNFKGNEKLDGIDLERKKAQFLYADAKNYNFMYQESYGQFALARKNAGKGINYLPEGSVVDVTIYNHQPISLICPIKVVVGVSHADPGIKGDRVSAGTKLVEIETGAVVPVPLFIKSGDKIIIDTRSGSYVERAK